MTLAQILAILFGRRRAPKFNPNPTPTPPPTPVPLPTPVPEPATIASVILGLNQIRARHGLTSALVDDPRLDRIASDYALHLALTGTFTHGDAIGRIWRVYPNTNAAENIAEGQTTAAEVDADWEQSAGHLRNILGDFNLVGVGLAKGAKGIIWVCDFDRS